MTNITRELKIQGEAARSLLANIRDVIGDDTEMAETAVEGETTLREIISDAVDRLEELKAHRAAIETRIKDLGDRRDRFEDQEGRIKAAVHVAMGQAEMRKLELPQATVSLRAVPPKAEVTDEALLPSKFFKTPEPKLDKTAVLNALKAKEFVPGARLSNGNETISIRVK